MSQYNKLAEIYDYLVAGIDYGEWADYIEKILHRFSCDTTYVADLACGTGNTTLPLAQRGYEVYGIDLAPAMLAKASEKARAAGLNPCFLEQDMRDLSLPRPVDLITCYHDGLNYIVDPEDLRRVFKRVIAGLRPGGLFIFDLNAVEKLSSAGGDTTFFDDQDISLIWETGYELENDIWKIKLTGFIRKGDLYDKFVEEHKERAYRKEEALDFLERTGFEILGVFHGFSFDPPKPTSRRLFYVARRPVELMKEVSF